MPIAEHVFWISLLLVVYTYFLYPTLLVVACSLAQALRDWQYLTSLRDRRRSPRSVDTPSVTLIVPAYNEEAHLPDKIANIRQLDYPPENVEVIFVSDGSTDRTNEILRAVPNSNAQTLFLPVRTGKPNALNQAVPRSRHDILIFSDASTLFAPDAVKKLVRHFSDPSVGVVCGAVQLRGTSESSQTEGVYWKYESILRLMEARLGVTLTASGAIFALRRQCYVPLRIDVLIEDLVIPMNARSLAYQVVYDPEAVATEFPASSVSGEFTRRVRIAVGSFQVACKLGRLRLDPKAWFAFFSHKLLRWFLPFLLIGLLVSNAALWSNPFYRIAFVGQLAFYLWAGLGFAFRRQMQRVRYGLIGYYLLSMHLAYLVGFARFLVTSEKATWQRVS